jgi:hypothetical protein
VGVDGPLSASTNRNVEFPIFREDARYWKSGRDRRVGGLPATALAIMDGVQPFDAGGDQCLWTLHEVDRVDKHVTVHAVGVVLEPLNEAPRFIVTRGTIVDHDVQFSGPLEHGADVGWVRTDPPEAEPLVRGRFRADIALDNRAGVMRLPETVLVGELVRAATRVEWLVNRFGPTMVR